MSAHPLHAPLAQHERYHRALWIFAVLWLFICLLVFWFAPVGVFRTRMAPSGKEQEVVRLLVPPKLHERPLAPKIWERFLLEQGFPIVALYLILSIPSWLASVLARSRSWWAGGILGVVVGYFGGWLFVDATVGFGGAVVVGLIGVFFDYLVSTHYKIRLLRGHMPAWWAGSHWGGRGHSQWRWGSA